ncbi:carbohydrate-binding module family 18 protein [Apiospora arundinis]
MANYKETEKIPDLPRCYEVDIDACTGKEKDEIQRQRDAHKKKKSIERTDRHKNSELQIQVEKEEAERWTESWDQRVKYEALSWCWGTDDPKYALLVRENGLTYKLEIKRELAVALKNLRYPHQMRTLWVDAVCIDQRNPRERNHQVQMMSMIYTRANSVCIWLGEHTKDSRIAIDFIRDEVMELRNIETMVTEGRYISKWQALQTLMQAEWFSRRWVIQEIALARQAKVYCGGDSITWKDFAIAVELFIEVETANHRLSETMQADDAFRLAPKWFEYMSELGASLLVLATGKVFRDRATLLQDEEEEEDIGEHYRRLKKQRATGLLERRSLLSLEHLVSSMLTFNVTEPRDAIYSFLAIARDATPNTGAVLGDSYFSFCTMRLFDQVPEKKPFPVDYSRSYPDVCQDFVSFVIQGKKNVAAFRALDILCRPWAMEAPKKRLSVVNGSQTSHERLSHAHEREREQKTKNIKTWERRQSRIGSIMVNGKRQWRLIKKDSDVRVLDTRTTEQYRRDYQEAYDNKTSLPLGPDWPEDLWTPAEGWAEWKGWCTAYENKQTRRDIEELPSWVACASHAPFSLDHHPGMTVKKVGRANSDPLVGLSTDGHSNYSAAQTRPVNLDVLTFRRRPELGHYSLYVQGFSLDEVVQVMDASQGGSIPRSWLDLGGWESPYSKLPPDALWRTLVADRGRDNRNTPIYYARACRESVQRGNISSGRVDTALLIMNERNSIISEYCRRVHAVIWNRRMFKTKAGRLGLAYDVEPGDKISVLYGCTVPVVLKQFKKKEGDIALEKQADRREALKACVRLLEENYERKQWRKQQHERSKRRWLDSGEWYEMLRDKEIAEGWLHRKRKSRYEDETQEEGDQEEGQQDENKKKRRKKKKKKTTKHGKEKEILEGDEKNSRTEQSKDGGDSLQEDSDCFRTSFKEKAKRDDQFLWYRLRGDCYLHGMMDGEAVLEKIYEDPSDMIFELR